MLSRIKEERTPCWIMVATGNTSEGSLLCGGFNFAYKSLRWSPSSPLGFGDLGVHGKSDAIVSSGLWLFAGL